MDFIFEGPEAERIRAQVPVSARPLYTKGSSTELYNLGDTVLLLSSDSSSHCFLVVAGSRGLAVPRCIKDWGAEFEKMSPLIECSDHCQLIANWFDGLERLGVDEQVITATGSWPSIHNVPAITMERMRN